MRTPFSSRLSCRFAWKRWFDAGLSVAGGNFSPVVGNLPDIEIGPGVLSSFFVTDFHNLQKNRCLFKVYHTAGDENSPVIVS